MANSATVEDHEPAHDPYTPPGRREVPLSAPDEPLGLVGRPIDQRVDPRGGLGPAAQHVGGDDLGVARVGPADPDADAMELGAPRPRFSDFSPLWPATRRRASSGRRRTGGRSRRGRRPPGRGRAGTAARRARRIAGLVHERLRGRTATRAPPGPVRPSLSSPANFFLAFGRSQRYVTRPQWHAILDAHWLLRICVLNRSVPNKVQCSSSLWRRILPSHQPAPHSARPMGSLFAFGASNDPRREILRSGAFPAVATFPAA